jgi:rhodanese-related sulfurtransferase
MPKKNRNRNINTRSGLAAFLRKPVVQLAMLAFVAFIVYLIAAGGNAASSNKLPSDISVDEAYSLYKSGAFMLDVRRQDEWDQYHVPNATLIPLDQLASRLNELPKDKPIIVICHSGNRSKQGRDILVNAGFNAASINGGLLAWYAAGYDFEGSQPQ